MSMISRKDHNAWYENKIRAWIDECCTVNYDVESTTVDLYASWNRWCDGNDVYPESRKLFAQCLKGSFKTYRGAGNKLWIVGVCA